MIKKSNPIFSRQLLLILFIILCLTACTGVPASNLSDIQSIDQNPQTYVGEIPCADCAAQRVVLTLFPDSTFRMCRTYSAILNGQDKTFYDLGQWIIEDSGDLLKLYGSNESMVQFRIMSSVLRMLDLEGREIDSTLNYKLSRQPDVDFVEGPMLLKGMYMYMADAAVFKECWTGNSYPVLIEADHLALERAYMEMRAEPGESIFVAFTGRFVQRMPEPGLPVREHLIVEQFDTIFPGKTCIMMTMEKGLFDLHWIPIQINGKSVILEPNQSGPYLVLPSKDSSVSGFAGCNRFFGRFEYGKEHLIFKEMATTKMACLSPAMDLEIDFLMALNVTTSYHLVGNTLELKDANGEVRMRLEGKNLNNLD
jgi:copper homeostasis protein (lipoprotein)